MKLTLESPLKHILISINIYVNKLNLTPKSYNLQSKYRRENSLVSGTIVESVIIWLCPILWLFLPAASHCFLGTIGTSWGLMVLYYATMAEGYKVPMASNYNSETCCSPRIIACQEVPELQDGKQLQSHMVMQRLTALPGRMKGGQKCRGAGR